MNIKYIKIVIFGIFIIASFHGAHAQYLRFTKENNGTNKIVVPENEVWQLVTARISDGYFEFGTSTNQPLGNIQTTYGYLRSIESASSGAGGDTTYSSLGSYFVGSLEIRPMNSGSGIQYYLVFKKISSSSSASQVSTTSVVIPTSATGDVDVKMEQSADNVTWTECLPGTYNSSTVKRFFRLRAVEK